MNRKKYISAGMQFALYQAGGQARKLLKKHVQKKIKQSVSGYFRKPGLQTAVKFSGMKQLANGIHPADGKKAKKRKRRVKTFARLAKYALRETRYS